MSEPGRDWVGRTFDESVLRKLQRNYGALPDWAQPAVMTAATAAHKQTHRLWLDRRLAQLSSAQRADFLPRLRSEEQYAQSVAELALGSVLADTGFAISHEPRIDTLTPDLLAIGGDNQRVLFEVWTRTIPPDINTRMRGWGALATRIATIEVPVLVAVDSAARSANDPPDIGESRPIVKSLRRWLVSGEYLRQRTLDLAGFRFTALQTVEGAHAGLVPVKPSTHADSRHVWDAINDKMSRYRGLVTRENLPFVVVLSAEANAGLDRDLVEGALRGDNSVSLNFTMGTFGPMEPRRVEIRQTNAPPVFDPCLSAVAWIEIPDDAQFRLTVWPIAGARCPIQQMEGPNVIFKTLTRHAPGQTA